MSWAGEAHRPTAAVAPRSADKGHGCACPADPISVRPPAHRDARAHALRWDVVTASRWTSQADTGQRRHRVEAGAPGTRSTRPDDRHRRTVDGHLETRRVEMPPAPSEPRSPSRSGRCGFRDKPTPRHVSTTRDEAATPWTSRRADVAPARTTKRDHATRTSAPTGRSTVTLRRAESRCRRRRPSRDHRPDPVGAGSATSPPRDTSQARPTRPRHRGRHDAATSLQRARPNATTRPGRPLPPNGRQSL